MRDEEINSKKGKLIKQTQGVRYGQSPDPVHQGSLGETVLNSLCLTYLFCKMDRIDNNPKQRWLQHHLLSHCMVLCAISDGKQKQDHATNTLNKYNLKGILKMLIYFCLPFIIFSVGEAFFLPQHKSWFSDSLHKIMGSPSEYKRSFGPSKLQKQCQF